MLAPQGGDLGSKDGGTPAETESKGAQESTPSATSSSALLVKKDEVLGSSGEESGDTKNKNDRKKKQKRQEELAGVRVRGKEKGTENEKEKEKEKDRVELRVREGEEKETEKEKEQQKEELVEVRVHKRKKEQENRNEKEKEECKREKEQELQQKVKKWTEKNLETIEELRKKSKEQKEKVKLRNCLERTFSSWIDEVAEIGEQEEEYKLKSNAICATYKKALKDMYAGSSAKTLKETGSRLFYFFAKTWLKDQRLTEEEKMKLQGFDETKFLAEPWVDNGCVILIGIIEEENENILADAIAWYLDFLNSQQSEKVWKESDIEVKYVLGEKAEELVDKLGNTLTEEVGVVMEYTELALKTLEEKKQKGKIEKGKETEQPEKGGQGEEGETLHADDIKGRYICYQDLTLGSLIEGDLYRCEYHGYDVAARYVDLSDSANIISLRREIHNLQTFNSPGIVHYYGYCIRKNAALIITEYPGDKLADVLGSLSAENRLNVLLNVAAAMKYVHFRGFMHRALTTSSIIVSKDSEGKACAKISQFGLSRQVSSDSKHTANASAGIFKAPELLEGRTDYNNRVDVFSFGIIMFNVLTNKDPPERNASSKEPYVEWPEEPSVLWEGKSYEVLKQLSMQCIAKEHEARPTFSKVRKALKQLL